MTIIVDVDVNKTDGLGYTFFVLDFYCQRKTSFVQTLNVIFKFFERVLDCVIGCALIVTKNEIIWTSTDGHNIFIYYKRKRMHMEYYILSKEMNKLPLISIKMIYLCLWTS